MRDLLSIFFRAEGTRPAIVLACLVVASLAEGLGLATLLPLINLAVDPAAAGQSAVGRVMAAALGTFGFELALGPLLVIAVGALIVKAVLNLVAMRYVGYATAEVAANIRRQLVASLMDVRWSFFVHQPMGRIANAMSNDATRAAQAYLLVAELLTQAIGTVVLGIVALFVSWKLALTAYLLGAVMTAMLGFLVRISRRAGWRQTERTKDLIIFLNDTLINIKPVKAMARQAAFANLLSDRINKLRRALRQQVISREALTALQETMLALVLGVGLYLTVGLWQVQISEVLVTGVLLSRLVSGIGKIQRAYQKAALFESAYLSARELIAEADAAPEPNPGRAAPRLAREIRLRSVSFAHEDTPVLHDVSMSVPAGALTVLAGPSGSGKTTIIDLILGLYTPERGEVLIDDLALHEIDLQRWRARIGYVPQELLLFNDTIRANVALGDPKLSDADVRAALETAGAWEFVERQPLVLDEVVGEKGAKLSGGQRQRIALARALVGRPELLVLDEVTSALDPVTAVALAREIRGLAARTTVIVVSHRPEFMEIADRIYRIEAGEVAQVSAAAAMAG